MPNKKYVLAAVIAIVAGFACIKNLHRNVPSDLRDAVADILESKDFDTSIPATEKAKGNMPLPKEAPKYPKRSFPAAPPKDTSVSGEISKPAG